MENLEYLIDELRRLPTETEWVEFKHNNYQPEVIGESISALANSAALRERSHAYMIWGIDNSTHEITGTQFNHLTLKRGNEEFANWLSSMLSPNAEYSFESLTIKSKRLVVLKIARAISRPVDFQKIPYIRVGSYTKKLQDHPQFQALLWDRLRSANFETQIAVNNLQADDALNLLGYTTYFELTNSPQPKNIQEILHYLLEDEILLRQDNGLFAISNLGALLFSKHLRDFPQLSRKAIRVIKYLDNRRLTMAKEIISDKGYALGLEGLHSYLEGLLPSQELIEGALRTKRSGFPSIAIREAVANALIHQDFSIRGTGPIVEVFDDRIEITNPGTPLIDIMRIIDNPPKSRNEKLAALMRRMRVCEEAGTGWDKITIACEMEQLPAPRINLYENSTKVILYARVPFTSLSTDERLWACYLHTCVKYVQNEQATNLTLRNRFGLEDHSAASVSRLIKAAMEANLIKPVDPATSPRYMRYIPIWG